MNNSALLTVTTRPAPAAAVDTLLAETTMVDIAELATLDTAAVARATTAPSAPVFVDTTGRRARWLRVMVLVIFLACAVYVGALLSGVLGGSVDLSTAMPHVTATATATAS
jgi:hypothetical protein